MAYAQPTPDEPQNTRAFTIEAAPKARALAPK